MSEIKLTVQAWADIVIKEWITKARAMDIPDGELMNSFKSHVITNSEGDPVRVDFVFALHAKMVDFGVGTGVTLDTRDSQIMAGLTKRRRRPYLYDTFYKQLAVLRHLLEEKNALTLERFIINQIES